MSCFKPSKDVMKMVIYTVCTLCVLAGIYGFHSLFTAYSFPKLASALWHVAIAVLGLYGTGRENICMIKAFTVNIILLAITTGLGMILISLGVSSADFDIEPDEYEIKLRKRGTGALIVMVLIIGLIMIAELFAGIYGYRLANLIQRESNENPRCPSPPAYGFQIAAGKTALSPFGKTIEA